MTFCLLACTCDQFLIIDSTFSYDFLHGDPWQSSIYELSLKQPHRTKIGLKFPLKGFNR